ncbi:MAG: right-handed parallel beta-helix repeat-containing protein [Candidatus Binatia bacterium]
MAHNADRRMLLAGLGAAGALTITRTARAATCGDAGPLGPTGPTLRDLSDQISKPRAQAETRFPIIGQSPSATAQFVITAPGVYFLTGPLTGAQGLNCIEVHSDQVEIHFDGWHIEGVPGARAGISTPSPQSNIAIYDPSFKNWPDTCIDLRNSPNCLCEEGWFQNCDGAGSSGTGPGILALGDRGFIFDCDQYNCLGSLMSVGQYGAIEEALSVGGSGGCFQCGDGGVIENSFAMQNAGVGVQMGSRSTLTLSRVIDNGGVIAAAECVVFDCEISGCPGAGVTVTGVQCQIEDLYVSGCPIGIDVLAGGGGTLVDLNHVVGAATGIAVDAAASRCLVIRNQVGGGTLGSVAYAITASSSYGSIRDVTSGGDINASPLGPVQAYDNLLY